MNRNRAVRSLAALAQSTRLDAFRLLVQAGPAGLAAGDLAERLDISPPALSFHLRGLSHAGLVRARQDGRFIYYSADFDAMESLLGFLTENCCGGSACIPARATGRKLNSRRAS
jgi:ArsR family transcriptional regulator, arsenate/arsenite/antimonite-responsive transcriptional repressor